MAKIQGVHVPATLVNHIINGNHDMWQEKGSTTTTVNTASSTSVKYADMYTIESVGSTVKNWSVARSTDVPTFTESGFQSNYSSLFTMITGIASPAATDFLNPVEYRMEGFDYEKIHGKIVTFGFWVKASIAGTYSFAIVNNPTTRSYVTTFTISGSNTWEFKTITVTLDNMGTWAFDNTNSFTVYIGTIAGSNYQTATLNQWQNGGFYVATGATNWQATNGATFRFAQFSMVEGRLGLGAKGFARRGAGIGQELALCQRYYEKTYVADTIPGTVTADGQAHWAQPNNANVQFTHFYNVRKRTRGYTTLIYNPVSGASSAVQNTTAGSLTASSSGGEPGHATFTVTQAPGASNTTVLYHITADARL